MAKKKEIVKSSEDIENEQLNNMSQVSRINPNRLIKAVTEEEVEEILKTSPDAFLIKKKILNVNQVIFLYFWDMGYGNIAICARKTGISRQAVYLWLQNNEFIRRRIQNKREEMIDFVQDKLFEVALNGNFNALKYIMSTIGASRGFIENVDTEEEEIEAEVEFEEVDFEEEKRKLSGGDEDENE